VKFNFRKLHHQRTTRGILALCRVIGMLLSH
jgi:hypothetical protein